MTLDVWHFSVFEFCSSSGVVHLSRFLDFMATTKLLLQLYKVEPGYNDIG